MRYIVTTGISVETSATCWKGLEDLRGRDLDELLRDPNCAELFGTLKDIRASVFDGLAPEADLDAGIQVAEAHFDRASAADLGTLPAEVATLVKMHQMGEIAKTSTVEILFGESNREHAALVAGLIHFLSSGENDDNGEEKKLPNLEVSLRGPFTWDPVKCSFEGGMNKLWTELSFEPDSAKFVLSGGYKAVLMDLMRRLPDGSVAFYMHEQKESLIQITVKSGSVATEVRDTVPLSARVNY